MYQDPKPTLPTPQEAEEEEARLKRLAEDPATSIECPVCAPLNVPSCSGCCGTGRVSLRDYYTLRRVLRI
jgi:hypothetical protein